MARRIRVYLVGVFLGCIMVYVFLIRGKNRDFGFWLPQGRVMEELTTKKLTFNAKATCQFACYQIDASAFQYDLKTADVNFSKSLVHEKPKKYLVEFNQYNAWILMYKDSSVVSDIEVKQKSASNCECPGS